MRSHALVEGGSRFSWDVPWRLELPLDDPPAEGHPVLVALHGYGQSAETFSEELALEDPPYALLLPNGPYHGTRSDPETQASGHSWYTYTGDQVAFRRDLETAERFVNTVVDDAAGEHGLDAGRCVLLGHSQGGYLAGFMALRRRDCYRGLVAASCRIKTEFLEEEMRKARGYPVLALHGRWDRSVKPEPQQEAVQVLSRHGVDARLEFHDRGHSLPSATMPLIDTFVRGTLGLAPRPDAG